MKHIRKVTISITIVIFFLFILPYFINFKFADTIIENYINTNYQLKTTVSALTWKWFPGPHLTAEGVVVESETFKCNTDKADIYVKLEEIFKGDIIIDRLVAQHPQIHIKKIKEQESQEDKQIKEFLTQGLPELIIKIENGELTFDNTIIQTHFKEIKAKRVALKNINITIESNKSDMTVNGVVSAHDIEKIHFSVSVKQPSDEQNKIEQYFCDAAINFSETSIASLKKIVPKKIQETEDFRTVSEILTRGVFKNALLSYQGNSDKILSGDNLLFTTVVTEGAIQIPDTDITLHKCSGKIKVTKKKFHGEDIVVSYGNSTGRNGQLTIGIHETDDTFKLNTDIDAVLRDIPGIITNFYQSEATESFLNQLKNINGEAKLNLSIGDDINNLKTTLKISDMRGHCTYHATGEVISANCKSGRINFADQRFVWDHATISSTNNKLMSNHGSFIWGKKNNYTIKDGTFLIDFDEQNSIITQIVADRLNPYASKISGQLTIDDFFATGTMDKIKMADFSFSAKAKNLSFLPKKLGGQLRLNSESIHVTDNNVTINSASAFFLNSDLNFTLEAKYANFTKFSGKLSLEGKVEQEAETWLKEKKWIPDSVFPALPCKLDPLTLVFSDKKINMTTRLLHEIKGDTKKNIVTTLDGVITDNKISFDPITIQSPADRAVISATVFPGDAEAHYAFEGVLKNSSIKSVLKNTSWMNYDTIEGQFKINVPGKSSGTITSFGNATIKQLSYRHPDGKRFEAGHLNFTGKGTELFFTGADGLYKNTPGQKERTKIAAPEFSGSTVFLPGKESRTEFTSSSVCGISMKGSVLFPSKKLDLNLTVKKSSKIKFSQIFQCLGSKKTKITGDVYFNANLKGTTKKITSGDISLTASNGNIDKITVLSKIFGVLNLTDLFSKNPMDLIMKNGYPYKKLNATGKIKGNLVLTEISIKGRGVNFYSKGTVDYSSNQLDLLVLASPLKDLDFLVEKIPFIGEKFFENRSILSIPVKVEGPVNKPEIKIVSHTIRNAASELFKKIKKIF